MNKFKSLAIAGLFGAGMAVAGGDIWDFPNILKSTNEPFWGQAKVPGAVFCWADAPTPSATTCNPQNSSECYWSPCYGATGGWWFGYGFESGIAEDNSSGADLTLTEAVKVEEWDNTEQAHVIIKGKGLGNSSEGSTDGGFDVLFKTQSGTDEVPSGAGLGFNWRNKDGNDYESKPTENLTGKSGLCITYKADKAGVDMELGWPTSFGDDNWIVKLPAASVWTVMDVAFTDFVVSYESPSDERPLSDALESAEALKFAFKNKAAEPVTVHFQLREVGWKGTCSGAAGTPINQNVIASSPKFSLTGRSLSLNASAFVQVINMQGAIVSQKTLAPNETLNLTNMPTGVYLVRAPKLGISQKIMVK